MSSEVAPSEDPRIRQVLDVIFQLAAGNLEARGAPSDRGDDLDAIVVGINMLAEEFSALHEQVERHAEELDRRVVERTAALRESEERYRDLYEHAPMAYFSVGLDGLIRQCNRAAVQLLGHREAADIVGRSVFELYPDVQEVRSKATEIFRHFADTGEEIQDEELPMRRADGAWVWTSLTVNAVRDGKGNILESRSIVVDITERRQRERELEALATVSAALRVTSSRAQMLPVILDQVLALLRADGAALGLRDATGDVVGELGRGVLAGFVGLRATAGEGVSGQVIASGQPYLSADLKRDPLFLRPELLPGDCAAVCVPLMAERQAIGVLWMVRQREFTAGEVRLLTAIANVAGNAMHRANLYEQSEQRSARLAVMSAIGRKLTGSLDLATVLAGILEETARVIPSHALTIMLYDERRGDLWIEAARGYPDNVWRTFRMPLGQGVTGRVAATRQPALIRNTALEPDWRGVEGLPPSGSELAVPLVFQDRLIGVLNLESQQPDAFGESELHLVMAIGDYAAIAIQNARLFVETGQRLQWMTALHTIDMTITASLDLRVTFSVLLEAVVSQLDVDAAAVLQLEPGSQILVYVAGRGFRSNAVERSRVRIGSGHAGRAALERRTIHVPDLREAGPAPQRAQLWATEGFVAHYAVPLIAKGEIQGVLELFHRSSLKGDPEWLNFLETLATQAAIAIDNVRLFERLQRSNADLTLAYEATIEGWSRALELRDMETEGHTLRVAEMAERLARALGVNEREMVHIRRGALLHDIGKMGIPDSILLKPGPLTEAEWAVMRRHPVYAYDMLSSIAYLRPALDIPYCHHEKWDGTGYPHGLRGEAIPLAARIFAVVDVWDALRSDRPYREAWPEERIWEYMRAQAGKHFDPAVVETFLRLG